MVFKQEQTFVKLYNGQIIGPLHPFEARKIDNRYGEGCRNNFGDREPKLGDIVLTDVECFPYAPHHNGVKVEIIDFEENHIGFGGNFLIVKNIKNGEIFRIMKEDIQWWFN